MGDGHAGFRALVDDLPSDAPPTPKLTLASQRIDGPPRDEVLARVLQRYYALPRWLPQTACYFCDRYFPGTP